MHIKTEAHIKALFTFFTLIMIPFSAFAFFGGSKGPVNVNGDDVAVKGHDVVAYFTENKAVEGSGDYASTVDGATYYFSSADHKALFDAAPQKYMPQYGGWCAYAVSLNKKVGIDPEAFHIHDGKLYLNYNAKTQKRWLENKLNLIQEADEIWPDLKHN